MILLAEVTFSLSDLHFRLNFIIYVVGVLNVLGCNFCAVSVFHRQQHFK